MNHLLGLEHLANRYLVMRHGHSLANQQGVIVSDPVNGRGAYGLSELGRDQVTDSLARQATLDADTIILSSDFARALESAELAHRWLSCAAPLQVDARLRERYFGELELGPDSAYADVWRHDARNASDGYRCGESALAVMARVTGLVVELERNYRGTRFLLVSHGDALQILQTAFARRPASVHRSLEHLQTAEIRPLALASTGS